MEGCVDRISGLPESILHHILSFLLTKDAIHTAVTCQRLNQVWSTLPFFDLGPNFFPILSEPDVYVYEYADEEDSDEEESDEEESDEEESDEEDVSGQGINVQGGQEALGLLQVTEEVMENTDEAREGHEHVMDNGSGSDIQTWTQTSKPLHDNADQELIETLSKRDKLFTFMEQTLKRRTDHDLTIQKFGLGKTKLDGELRQHLDRWIHYLVGCNIKELVLTLNFQHKRYDLPPILLSATSLFALSMTHCGMPSGAISLLSLRKLSLVSVCISDNLLRDIIRGCRDLEDLKLERCFGLKEKTIQISGQSQSMRYLNLIPEHEIDNVVVEAQYLEKISWNGRCRPIKIDIMTNSEGSLKSLTLMGADVTDKWFRVLISKLQRLEELTLAQLNLKSIEISSSSLKRLLLYRVFQYKDDNKSWDKKFGEFTVNTPNLVYLNYTDSLSSVFLTSVTVKEVFLSIDEDKMICTPEEMCCKLTQFLSTFDHAEVVTVDGTYFEHLIIPIKLRLNLHAPFGQVKHLILQGILKKSPDYDFQTLVESLMWMSPRLEKLSFRSNRFDVDGHRIDLDLSIKITACSTKHDCTTSLRNCFCHLTEVRNCLCHVKFELEGTDAERFRFMKNCLNLNA